MKKAWVWLVLILASFTVFRLIQPSEPLEVKVVLFITAILNPAILLYLIRLVRHQVASVGAPSPAPELSTWDYFWRAYVLFYFQLLLLLFVSLIVPLNLRVNEFDAVRLVLWELPFAVVSAAGAWLLYSTDRRGQLQLLIEAVRGY